MDELRHLAGTAEQWISGDSVAVAESVHKDFSGLIAIFDRQLNNGLDQEARVAIAQARAAAARGLELSERLIELLRDDPPS